MFLVAVAITLIWSDVLNPSWLGGLTTPLLLQAWIPHVAFPGPPFDGPEWTLSCEAFFYAIFPFVRSGLEQITPRQRDGAVLGLGILTVAGAAALTHFGYFNIAYTNPVIRSFEFVFGMWLAMRLRGGWRPRIPVIPAVLLVVIAYEIARRLGTNIVSGHGNYVVLIPVGIVLLAGARADLAGRKGILTWPVSVYLGEISFAFYLVQVPITTPLLRTSWGGHWSGVTGIGPFLVMFAVSLAGAILLHHVVELPMQRRLRGPGRASIATTDPQVVAHADDVRGGSAQELPLPHSDTERPPLG
jgi:peptidoglycan/LPS O-acetylase OafA/YrhL